MNNLMLPQTLSEAMQYSEMMAKSQIIPKDYQGKPENVLVAVQWGHEIGLPPLQAMQNIAVINGRPSLWGDAVLALVRGSGKLEMIDERIENEVAICRVKRKGELEQVRTFSMAEAKQAGLLGKQGPWSQYPNRMLQMRARAFAMRDVFPDVLKGIAVAEEVQDVEAVPSQPSAYVAPAIEAPKALPLAKEVGELLLNHCNKDSAVMKKFVIDTLELPEDAELTGKWMQQLNDDDLRKLKARINEQNQPQLPLE